jgi:hypothetical protein
MLLEQATLFEIVERRLQHIGVKSAVETAASTELIPKRYGLHAKGKGPHGEYPIKGWHTV